MTIDTPRKLILMAGYPRCGKSTVSTYLSNHLGFSRIGADDIRDEYGIKWGTDDQREDHLFYVAKHRLMEQLHMGKNAVFDSTAMYADIRRLMFDTNIYFDSHIAGTIPTSKYIVQLDTDWNVLLARQVASGRKAEDLERYRREFQPIAPMPSVTILRYTSNTKDDLDAICSDLCRKLS
ncbi:TPA: ATP-binding protein [Candidatus Woesearchaeota archaeon]|nr:ATP-binding protein [Candidatus Woesearchaeota archaeon]